METALYMRVRGRVLGPYDQEKLQGLARRGQLSRMHELSQDGVTWVCASNFPELFTISQNDLPSISAGIDGGFSGVAVNQQATSVNQEPSSTHSAIRTSESAQSTASAQWFYTCAGVQRGPVDFINLQMLVGTGQLSADDLVWTEGMGAWTPARGVPGLIRSPGGSENGEYSGAITSSSGYSSGGYTNRAGGDFLSEGLVRSAVGSRGWVLFIAIAFFVLTAITTLMGIFSLVAGARIESPVTVAIGVSYLIGSLISAVYGFLLMTYANRLAAVRMEPRPIVLEKCMDSLKTIWIFTAFWVIIWMATFATIAVYSVAIGAAMTRP